MKGMYKTELFQMYLDKMNQRPAQKDKLIISIVKGRPGFTVEGARNICFSRTFEETVFHIESSEDPVVEAVHIVSSQHADAVVVAQAWLELYNR